MGGGGVGSKLAAATHPRLATLYWHLLCGCPPAATGTALPAPRAAGPPAHPAPQKGQRQNQKHRANGLDTLSLLRDSLF